MKLNKKHYLLLILITISISSSINAKTIIVCPDCSTSTIKQAIEVADDNDEIFVKKGTYQEMDILITKPLTLRSNQSTVDGQNHGEVFIINADNVTIDGFTIINVGTSYLKDYAAIRVRESKNFTIQNNTIKDLFFGIYLEKSKQGKVIGNKIYGKATHEFNSGNGIQLWYSNNIEIKNNYVEKVRDGIYLEFANNCEIENNISKDNVRYGLHFMFSNNNIVNNCSYINNGAGVAIMFSKEMKMIHNNFIENWGPTAYGILLKEVNDTDIQQNTFNNNTTAITIEGTNRVKYSHNNFINNGWAINLKGANYLNEINYNNFINNSFDLIYSGQLNNNNFNSNYWSNYTGYDLDKDGVGDIPYHPIKLFSYIVSNTPEAIVLLRSSFVDIINFSETASPTFIPKNLVDATPLIKKLQDDSDK